MGEKYPSIIYLIIAFNSKKVNQRIQRLNGHNGYRQAGDEILSFNFQGDHYQIIPAPKENKFKVPQTKGASNSNSQPPSKGDNSALVTREKNDTSSIEIQAPLSNSTLNSTPNKQDTILKPVSEGTQISALSNEISCNLQVQSLLDEAENSEETIELMVVLDQENELVSEFLLSSQRDYDIRGPMAEKILELNPRDEIQYERSLIRIGQEYQAKIPPLTILSGNPPPRKYRQKCAPLLINFRALTALEVVLREGIGIKNLISEKLVLWLQELEYDFPKMCLEIFQNVKAAEKRLKSKTPRVRTI